MFPRGSSEWRSGSKFPVCQMFINVNAASPSPGFRHSGLEFGTWGKDTQGDLNTRAFTGIGGTASLTRMCKGFCIGGGLGCMVWWSPGTPVCRFVILVECNVAGDSLSLGFRVCGSWKRTQTFRPAGCLSQAGHSPPQPHRSSLDQKIPNSLKY